MVTTVDTMTVPLTEVFFPSVVVCNINQVRKSFFEELGIYDNDTFIRQIYFDYIEGKKDSLPPLSMQEVGILLLHLTQNYIPSYATQKTTIILNDAKYCFSPIFQDGQNSSRTPDEKIATHTKIMEEYLKKMNESADSLAGSINWVTHQKCKDMFILSKVRYFCNSFLMMSNIFA